MSNLRELRAACQHPNAVLVKGWPKTYDSPGRRDRVYLLRCPDCGLKWHREERER